MLSIDTTTHRSPNHDSREGTPISLLVLHYTGMKNGAAALDRLCDPTAKVSAHYVVEEDGRVFRLVEEQQRAWHAGVSYWRGIEKVNAASIGVEIVNPGHEYGYRAFPEVQMKSVLALCQEIIARHSIRPRNVVGHSDVAPERKEDPGELFNWQWLAQHGVGAWPKKEYRVQSSEFDKSTRDNLPPPLRGEGVSSQPCFSIETVQSGLIEYGYNLRKTRVWDEATKKVATAFQRHFRPENLSGEWDAECEVILKDLLSVPDFFTA